MNRPERRNALSQAHMQELITALREIGDSDALGIVLAGNGPVFSAGHDFADVVDADLAAVRALLVTCTELMTLIQQVPQPVVARVHGLATAAGCQLVASADLAVASETRVSPRPAARAAGSATPRWWRSPATSAASGRWRWPCPATSSTHGPRWTGGWSTGSSRPRSWTPPVADLLERVTRGSAESKGIGKQALYAQIDLDQPKAYAYAIEVMAATSQLPDARECMRSFLGKRKPQWRRGTPVRAPPYHRRWLAPRYPATRRPAAQDIPAAEGPGRGRGSRRLRAGRTAAGR